MRTAPVALVLAVLALVGAPRAQDARYAVTAETHRLADGAPALVRTHATEFVVAAPGRATTRVHRAVTAFGPGGRELVSRLQVPYDGFVRVTRFEGTLRGADGAVVRRLGRRDAVDRSATTVSFQDDLQVREAELWHDTYPYTVEWSYELEHDGVLAWPTWRPQSDGRPVERASLRLTVPTGMPVRAQAQHLDAPPLVTETGGQTTYLWSLAPTPAFRTEPLGPAWEAQVPTLFLATTGFAIGGTRGRGDTWDGLGGWYGRLSAGRDALPEAARAEVHRIVAGAPTQREAARRLYAHHQRTTRYVSIQLGLGGWQPFDAAYVFERRYGDCKALVNYLQAMLREAGIRADPVLVDAGDGGTSLDPAFPRNGFNHVILRVSLDDGETVWLESTSAVAAFGHLGAFTENRPALLVAEGGGQIVQTPASRPADNLSARHATVRLTSTGDAVVDADWRVAGDPRADVLWALADRPAGEQAAWLHTSAGLSGFDIDRFDVADVASRPDTLRLAATLRVARFARRAGRRLLVPLRPFATPVSVPAAVDERTQPVRLGAAVGERDRVEVVLPEGYAVERLPPPVEIATPFGRYARTVVLRDDGAALVVHRRFETESVQLPAEAYASVRAFLQAVAEADAAYVVLDAPR